MSVKTILSLTISAALLLLMPCSAQAKADTDPWAAAQTTSLEGFGRRLTIQLPPLEYCQLGRFSTKSEGNDFGIVGNTSLQGGEKESIYISINSEETAAFSDPGTVAD